MNMDRFQEAADGLYSGRLRLSEVPRTPDWVGRVQEVDDLLNNRHRLTGYAHERRLREAMTMDDFPLLFGDTLNRTMRARYEAVNPGMRQIVKWRPTRDFRQNKTFLMTGLDGRLQEVGEKGERLSGTLTESKTYWYLKKYGRQCDFSWEAYINGEYGLFSDIPARLIDAAVNTREYLITSQLCDNTGPIDATFAIATATTPLSIGNLEIGIAAMMEQTIDPGTGVVPLNVKPRFLVVPPRLKFMAMKILMKGGWGQWVADDDDVTPPAQYPMANVIPDEGLSLIVNPWLPIIDTTSGNTAWYLISDPNGSTPLLEFGGLMGREEPEIFMKGSDKIAVGGGPVSPFEGDFSTENIYYAIRYCIGGGVCDTYGGYASTGVG
jgi:hypothetical protein